jgi:hypothetical protein
MSSEDHEAMGYGHDLDLLIFSLYRIVPFISNDKVGAERKVSE